MMELCRVLLLIFSAGKWRISASTLGTLGPPCGCGTMALHVC